MTSKTIEANSSVFSLGMAVAPVTDWRFYGLWSWFISFSYLSRLNLTNLSCHLDSIYTERYMKTPLQNPDGYEESAVTDMEGFRHAKFLLVHGTGDGEFPFTFFHPCSYVCSTNGVAQITSTSKTRHP